MLLSHSVSPLGNQVGNEALKIILKQRQSCSAVPFTSLKVRHSLPAFQGTHVTTQSWFSIEMFSTRTFMGNNTRSHTWKGEETLQRRLRAGGDSGFVAFSGAGSSGPARLKSKRNLLSLSVNVYGCIEQEGAL